METRESCETFEINLRAALCVKFSPRDTSPWQDQNPPCISAAAGFALSIVYRLPTSNFSANHVLISD